MFNFKLRINVRGTRYLARIDTLRGACLLCKSGWRVIVWEDWVYPGHASIWFHFNCIIAGQNDAIAHMLHEMHYRLT